MSSRAGNVVQIDVNCSGADDALYAAIVDETCELAAREIDRIAGNLGADRREVCCALLLAVLRRMALEGENPYDTLNWAFDALGFLTEATAFEAGARPDR